MPNWVDQELNVIGPRDDIERFCKLAVVSPPKSDRGRFWLPEFAFTSVCPARPGDEQAAERDPEYRDLFRVVWSRTQANFSIQTAWVHSHHVRSRVTPAVDAGLRCRRSLAYSAGLAPRPLAVE